MKLIYPKIKLEFNILIKYFPLIIVFFFSSSQLLAQKDNFSNVTDALQAYSKAYREVAYCHLNKSTYIKGEMLGFSAYVLNKSLKQPSLQTKNLYCVITDHNGKVVKSKLVKVNNGFANNTFNLDSLFVSGNYTFKAYTNWMKNFNERNAFVEQFRIINPDEVKTSEVSLDENIIDAQFLPEGGHFVDKVKTNVGVAIKDINGHGVANSIGNVYDETDKLIASFKTNLVGIGRFTMWPDINKKYRVEIKYLNKKFNFNIDNVKLKGVVININNSLGKIAVEFNTNDKTLNEIKGKLFKLIIHNGKTIKETDIQFNANRVVKFVDYEKLLPGINIFTLFDENKNPVLERLFFNYEGVNIINSEETTIIKNGDSLQITVPYNLLKLNKEQERANVSVSILPASTKSYKRHHSIISYNYLQPYVKGYIENAKYYFTNINRKKKYDLDNLLITQGWSSYNWQNIFNNTVVSSFKFEDGITVKGNKNSKNKESFMLYPLQNNDGFIVELSETDKSFIKSGFYPEVGEKLSFGVLNNKGKINKPNLYVQFQPSKVPDYSDKFDVLIPKKTNFIWESSNAPFNLVNLDNLQYLEEVFIEADDREVRIKKLNESPFDNIDVFDDKMRSKNLTLPNYINAYVPGFYAYDQGGSLTINKVISSSLVTEVQSPIIYLDDLLISTDYLVNFDMSVVDYITVNRHGHGQGFIGSNGVIKIYTLKSFHLNRNREFLSNYDFPLAYSKSKTFYVPKYNVYNDPFFKDYGVIDWVPNCNIDSEGQLNFSIYNPGNHSLKLFIEGITSSGSILAETLIFN